MSFCQTYEWATHQPLIKAVMEAYHPGFVLELGSGEFSTPLFIDYNVQFLTVENNREWADRIESKYGIWVLFHELTIGEGTHYDKVSEKQRNKIAEFYNDIYIPSQKPALLFVDQYMACRAISINTLRDKFDLILYHDSESIEINRYDLIKRDGFKFWTLKTSATWTTLMARTEKELKIQPFIDEFLATYPDCKYMELCRT